METSGYGKGMHKFLFSLRVCLAVLPQSHSSLDDSFAFAELLSMLDEGVLCLTSDPTASNDCWNLQQQELRILNHKEIVKFCVGSAPARAFEQDSVLEVNEEVADVLRTLQIQPRFYKRYRRFVVLSEGFEKIPDEGVSV